MLRPDHPRVRSPKGVMSCDEIRYWLRELKERHGWGWSQLARALNSEKCTVKGKLKGKWIYPGEQIRFSRSLDRILAGELVPVSNGQRREVHIVHYPKPLAQPPRLVYQLSTGRLSWLKPRQLVKQATLPSFSLAASRVWMPE